MDINSINIKLLINKSMNIYMENLRDNLLNTITIDQILYESIMFNRSG